MIFAWILCLLQSAQNRERERWRERMCVFYYLSFFCWLAVFLLRENCVNLVLGIYSVVIRICLNLNVLNEFRNKRNGQIESINSDTHASQHLHSHRIRQTLNNFSSINWKMANWIIYFFNFHISFAIFICKMYEWNETRSNLPCKFKITKRAEDNFFLNKVV